MKILYVKIFFIEFRVDNPGELIGNIVQVAILIAMFITLLHIAAL